MAITLWQLSALLVYLICFIPTALEKESMSNTAQPSISTSLAIRYHGVRTEKSYRSSRYSSRSDVFPYHVTRHQHRTTAWICRNADVASRCLPGAFPTYQAVSNQLIISEGAAPQERKHYRGYRFSLRTWGSYIIRQGEIQSRKRAQNQCICRISQSALY